MKRRKIYTLSAIALSFMLLLFIATQNVVPILHGIRDARLSIAGFKKLQTETEHAKWTYYRGGKGEKKVLFIHGFGPGGGFTWMDAMQHLGPEFDILVPDLMWFGDTEGFCEPTLSNQAKELYALCEKLDFMPSSIAGISYGGFVALELLNQQPHLNADLLIVNSPGTDFDLCDVEAMCQRAGVETIDELFIPKELSGVKNQIDFVTSGDAPALPDFVFQQIFDLETRKFATEKTILMEDLVYNADYYRNNMRPVYDRAGVIWSLRDSVFPMRYGIKLAERLDAELYTLEHSGHIPMPADKETYVESMRQFLSK